MSTSAAPIAAKKEQKKLCLHALTAVCKFGTSCKAYHAVSQTEALPEYAAKKTLTICGFYPKCSKSPCPYLHVVVSPKTAAVAVDAPKSPLGSVPVAAKKGPHHSDRRGAPSKGVRKDTSSVDEPEAFKVLHQIRGKVNALNRTEVAFKTLASTIRDSSAVEKAKIAHSRQVEILAALRNLGSLIDGYLLELGADPADTSSEEEEPAEDGTSPDFVDLTPAEVPAPDAPYNPDY